MEELHGSEDVIILFKHNSLDREEWLSENVYYYDRETGGLEIVL